MITLCDGSYLVIAHLIRIKSRLRENDITHKNGQVIKLSPYLKRGKEYNGWKKSLNKLMGAMN